MSNDFNSLIEVFQSSSDRFAATKARDGAGFYGVWPNENTQGVVIEQVAIVGINVKAESKVKYYVNGKQLETPAVKVWFSYRYMDPESGQEREINGESMDIPIDPTVLPEDQEWKYDAAAGRLKNFANVLLGEDQVPGNTGAVIVALAQLLDTWKESGVEAQARVRFSIVKKSGKGKNADKVYTNREDSLIELAA